MGRAIASVAAQTMGDWELIVVDDGSEDDLASVVDATSDRRVHLLRHRQNRGAAAARNTGIRAGRAPLVAFLDSDDVWLPEKLERQIAAIERSSGSLGALATAFRLVRMKTGHAEDRYPRGAPTWRSSLLDGCFVSPGSTLMARRECFDAVGVFDESLRRFEDWDWLLRLVERYEFDCLPEVLAIVNVGDHPEPSVIDKATRAMEARQAVRILAAAGPSGLRRFRASLALERANAAMAAKRHAAATVAIVQASLRSPRRTALFLARGLARLKTGDV